jgi:Flp pilus assembly protein TadG
MSFASRLARDEKGATVIEMAFALPTLIVMIWAIVQLGMVFRAMSGIQHALGEGARFATIYPAPTAADVKQKMSASVYGTGPGTFTVPTPTAGAGYLDLQVTYSQPTSLLLVPGPTINVSRSKRVWVAS